MTSYDLHRQKVNLTMVSAHHALKTLYKEFGADILNETIEGFRVRDEAATNTPVDPRLTYVKGSDLALG